MADYATTDPHTHHRVGEPLPVHTSFLIDVDFDVKKLTIYQRTEFDRPGLVHLDCDGQQIASVENAQGETIPYEIGEWTEDFGAAFAVTVPEDRILVLRYATGENARGLQWVTPAQADSTLPVLYSQFESIAGRSVFILPDAPSVRMTWDTMITVPKEMRGLMSAGTHVSRTEHSTFAQESWKMDVRVPLYLIAINVGEFEYRGYDSRSGVWANPTVLDEAYDALSRTPAIIAAAERLFGPYLWGAYTTIVLPKRGFPYGAMEHPCMTSMNAMLVADQPSASRVSIHELQHSWFGNLITNGSWEDFWLNEGVTTFAEWQVIGEVLGTEAMHMQIALAIEELKHVVAGFYERGDQELTKLKTGLAGRSPDAAFSRVPYYKGALFLWTLMERVGRERMLAFLRKYVAAYRYTSITTEEFLRFASEQLDWDAIEFANARAWVYEPGLPATLPNIASDTTRMIGDLAQKAVIPSKETTANWMTPHWTLYLAKLSRTAPAQVLEELDKIEGFSKSKNGMLQFEFLQAAIQNEFCLPQRYLAQIRSFLLSYGRTVYTVPLYEGLVKRGCRADAHCIFREAEDGYHPEGARRVREMFERHEAKAA